MGLSGAGSSWARQPGYVEVGGLHFRRFELRPLRRPAARAAVSGQSAEVVLRDLPGRRSEGGTPRCAHAATSLLLAPSATLVSTCAAARSRAVRGRGAISGG